MRSIVISINFILFALVSSDITDDYIRFLGAIILLSPLVLKIKAILRIYPTKVFNNIVIVLLLFLLLLALYRYRIYIYSTDFYGILKLFFIMGILYFQLDAFAYLEYKEIYGSLVGPAPVKPKAPIPTSAAPSPIKKSTSSKTRTSKDFFVECINCGEKYKNPTTDLCTKCGKSISIKSSTVKCTNCGGEFDSKESNCPYCGAQKV